MHPDLEKMIPLQALDLEAQRLRNEMALAPKRITEEEGRARAAEQSRIKLAAAVTTEEVLRRRLESDINDLREKLARARRKVDAATTTTQVTALEHEIAFAEKEISRLEDLELESMERSETLEAEQATATTKVSQAAAQLATERERTKALLDRDKAAFEEVDGHRRELRSEILRSETGESSLSRYDRIAAHRGTAITEALLGKCTACGMMLRPQLWQDLRDNSPGSPSHDTLTSCENCGRILYYDPARDAPQRKPVQNESLAAAIVRSSI